MEQIVYIDIYFLINFSMDVICFFLASKLLTTVVSVKRELLASVIGAGYACVSLLCTLNGIFSLLADLFACFGMCLVAIKRKGNLREVCEYTVVYAAVSIVLGGVMTTLFSFFNRIGLDKLLGSQEDADGISVWLFAILAIIGGGASLLGGRFFRKKSSRRNGEVKIHYGEKNVCFKAFCDSGNLLTEPISSKPCIIVEKREMEKILPYGIVKMIRSGMADGLSEEEKRRVRVIPASTVGGDGLLYAVRMDDIQVNMGKGWSRSDAFVAFGSIGNNADGAKALLPSSVAFGVV